MDFSYLDALYSEAKARTLQGRYIQNRHIVPFLDKFSAVKCGESVLRNPVYLFKLGAGKRRVLMWSQMHGNESTCTKVLFDLLEALRSSKQLSPILKACTLQLIPILNPDGAENYTRNNANDVDLNRDAQLLSQPESQILRSVFRRFKPDYCFNLHDQRTIYGVGTTGFPAMISFLAPAQDKFKLLTATRKEAMRLIVAMNDVLQKYIPHQIGRYDDSFNINCVGDTFQACGVPTLLVEAGQAGEDYSRESTRENVFKALAAALFNIAAPKSGKMQHERYSDIPNNEKLYFDLLIKDVCYRGEEVDIGIIYKESLKNGQIEFCPEICEIGNLQQNYGHKEIRGRGQKIEIHFTNDSYENVIVKKNDDLLKIFLSKLVY